MSDFLLNNYIDLGLRLREALAKYPEILLLKPKEENGRERFQGILKDVFPKEPFVPNLILLLYDMGLHAKVKESETVDTNLFFQYTDKLVDGWTIDRGIAESTVYLFCIGLGARIINDLDLDALDKIDQMVEEDFKKNPYTPEEKAMINSAVPGSIPAEEIQELLRAISEFPVKDDVEDPDEQNIVPFRHRHNTHAKQTNADNK